MDLFTRYDGDNLLTDEIIRKRKDLIYDFALDTGPIKAKIYEAAKHVKID